MNLAAHLLATGQAAQLVSAVVGKEPRRSGSGSAELARWDVDGSERNLILYTHGVVFDPKSHGEGGEDLINFAKRRLGLDFRGTCDWLRSHGFQLPNDSDRRKRKPAAPAEAAIRRLKERAVKPRRIETERPELTADEKRRLQAAQEIMATSSPWPSAFDSQHPAWLWATSGAKQGAWDATLPAPPWVRWISSHALENGGFRAPNGIHPGAGAIVAPLYPFAAWLHEQPPQLAAVALIYVDADGGKPACKATDKLTYGLKREFRALAVFGNLAPAGRLVVVEGIADALAVFRTEAAAAGILTAQGLDIYSNPDLAAFIRKRGRHDVDCWIDADDKGAGAKAARKLVEATGALARIKCMPFGKDPYDVCKDRPTVTRRAGANS